MNRENVRPHYGLLDTLRGLCIISMVAYHAMYDIVSIMGYNAPWYYGWQGHLWQQSICWLFILLSGLCWQLSRHHLKRGLILVGCGAGITIVTYLAMPNQLILYGVLNLLGLSALLLIPLHKLFKRLPPLFGLAASLILFFILRGVPQGYLGFEGIRICELPAALYQWNALAMLGLPPPGFFSTDYFPLIPWFFLFTSGYFLFGLLSKRENLLNTIKPGVPPLSFLGRHSLLIYLLHQPVLMLIFLPFMG